MDDAPPSPAEDGPEEAAPEGEPVVGEDAPPKEPPSLEMALSWLAKIRPATLLGLLRDPDFALVSVTAFAGFRVGATGYANPIVRKRLALEAIRDDRFAEKLSALAEESPPVISPPLSPTPATHETKPDAAAQTEERLAALRSERDQRRRERDDARQALSVAETGRSEAERQRRQAEKECDEAQAQMQRQAQRLARLERQVMRLQSEQADLLRALRQQDTDKPSRAAPETPFVSPPLAAPSEALPNLWRTAVAHLLDKRRYEVAVGIAQDVLRADPENLAALDIAARAHEAKGETQEAVPLRRRQLAAASAHGAAGDAAETLLRLLLSAAPGEIERDLRAFLAPLHADNLPQVTPIRAALARLRGLAPNTHAEVAALVEQFVPPALKEALLPTPGQLQPDDPLPLSPSWTPTARHLIRAVDAGDAAVVERAHELLAALARTYPNDAARIEAALSRAAGEDSSVLIPLFRSKGRGPVVVDGSNAAWHGQEALAAKRPRLRPLLELRRVLRTRGYFPVCLYGDAPLPYTIDEPAQLRRMVENGEITLVDSGVDADEVLLREAKRLGAPLVTNDHMTDWDPWNEVEKIRYTLSHHGEAYLMADT